MDNGSVRTLLNEQAYKFLGLVYMETLYHFDCSDAVELLQLFSVDSILYFYY